LIGSALHPIKIHCAPEGHNCLQNGGRYFCSRNV
jgi:hypothetical protein